MRSRIVLALASAALTVACTLPISKQAIDIGKVPVGDATFVSEEDSGLALLGLFHISEPDHYAVLLERARKRYVCDDLHSIQVDFYNEYWVIVSFTVARITAICEHTTSTRVRTSTAS